MSTPHKHAAQIHALADGKGVDYCRAGDAGWTPLTQFSAFDDPSCEFLLAPHRWQACIDAQKAGKAVQGRLSGEIWMDGVWNFNDKNTRAEYRIKPDRIRFRLGKYRDSLGLVEVRVITASGAPSGDEFCGWLGDWQEVAT